MINREQIMHIKQVKLSGPNMTPIYALSFEFDNKEENVEESMPMIFANSTAENTPYKQYLQEYWQRAFSNYIYSSCTNRI